MAQDHTDASKVRFGVFEVDLGTGELRKRGVRLRLQEQPFQVLALLLARRGEVVSREQLRQRLWNEETFVDFDHSLNAAVQRLRESLGDTAENPRFIETLPRRGYRFIAPVDIIAADDEARARTRSVWPAAVAGVAAVAFPTLLVLANAGGLRERLFVTAHPIQSIAVLPLENLSANSGDEYFADGITETLTTDLARIGGTGGLRVISRTSTERYRGQHTKTVQEIARELDVDAVVEGAVLRSGNRVRITAQLIQASPEKHLWADSYERDLVDVLALQSDVARAIANEIRIRVAPRDAGLARQVDREAYEAYLRGLHASREWTEDGTRKSIAYFEHAVEKDPTNADAWARLARAYGDAGFFGWEPVQVVAPKAKQAALRALQLDETIAAAHASLAWVRHNEWAWDQARRELQRAIALDPSDADAHQIYGYHLTITGELEEAIAEMKRALALDPLSGNKHNSLGAALYLAGHDDEALEQFHQTPDPDINSGQRHRRMADIYERKGMPAEAIRELLTLIRMSKRDTLAALVERTYREAGYAEANRTFLREDAKQAQEAARAGRHLAFQIAGDYALLGDKDQAFQWLEKAFTERDPPLIFLKTGDRFESLRTDPRFGDLLRRMGLPT
jgi:TolB-like protein/DNA-binding winged helix-turn-helix (wHTH) protein/lipoprotein NlpI